MNPEKVFPPPTHLSVMGIVITKTHVELNLEAYKNLLWFLIFMKTFNSIVIFGFSNYSVTFLWMLFNTWVGPGIQDVQHFASSVVMVP